MLPTAALPGHRAPVEDPGPTWDDIYEVSHRCQRGRHGPRVAPGSISRYCSAVRIATRLGKTIVAEWQLGGRCGNDETIARNGLFVVLSGGPWPGVPRGQAGLPRSSSLWPRADLSLYAWLTIVLSLGVTRLGVLDRAPSSAPIGDPGSGRAGRPEDVDVAAADVRAKRT